MTASSAIISFRTPLDPQRSEPDAAKLIVGRPQLATRNYYVDATNQFFSGIWEATRGAWCVQYTEHEFCHLLAGRVLITSEAGERYEFAAGDSFVIPAGFSGTWEVLEDCRKLYVIFEPSSS